MSCSTQTPKLQTCHFESINVIEAFGGILRPTPFCYYHLSLPKHARNLLETPKQPPNSTLQHPSTSLQLLKYTGNHPKHISKHCETTLKNVRNCLVSFAFQRFMLA